MEFEGIVLAFYIDKGFGFLESYDGDRLLFRHTGDVSVDAAVKYHLVQGKKGTEAVLDAVLIEGHQWQELLDYVAATTE